MILAHACAPIYERIFIKIESRARARATEFKYSTPKVLLSAREIVFQFKLPIDVKLHLSFLFGHSRAREALTNLKVQRPDLFILSGQEQTVMLAKLLFENILH